MADFIIKGDICWSKSNRELNTVQNGYLVCRDGKSCGVFTDIPADYSSFSLYDYSGMLVFPGMTDLHIHAPQFSFRSLGMDMELMEWLVAHAFPEESKFADLNYAEKAYGILADTLKYSATGRICAFGTVHRPATELLMDLMEASGLCSFIGKVNMNRDCPDALCEKDSAGETRRWLREVCGKYEHTKPIITPRFIPSCTDDLMKELGVIQKEFGVAAQSHLSENPSEIAYVNSLQPDCRFYGEGYDRVGLFGGDCPTIMAHCVYSSEEEMALMKRNGVFVAHCPASNVNVCSGIAPVRKYLEYGLKVGLASDVAGGETESMFHAIVDAIQTSKFYWRLVDQSYAPLTFPEAFYLATVGSGAFFGKVGSFDAGYEVDAVVYDDSKLPHPQELGLQDRAERAVYLSLDLIGIKAKFVAGRKLF